MISIVAQDEPLELAGICVLVFYKGEELSLAVSAFNPSIGTIILEAPRSALGPRMD